MVNVKVTCRECKEEHILEVQRNDYENWQARKALIQDAFPYLNAGQRELLISQICPPCFDSMFGEE